MHFVNETASSLLLTASTDGNIRLFRDYDKVEGHLTSAFCGLRERLSVSRQAGVVTAWEQTSGHLLVGGDSKYIRCWDADREALIEDFTTQAGSNVTALASDTESGQVFVAGFGDGVVRMFDKRMGPDQAVVRVLRQHHTWIQSLHLQVGGERDLVTGSMNGDIKIWDIRSSESPISSTNVAHNGLSALAVHDHAPIFAVTSAPYSSASNNTHSTNSRRGQTLGVYRMEKQPETVEDPFQSRGRSDRGSVSGSGFDLSQREGPPPVCLSSTLLKPDSGNTLSNEMDGLHLDRGRGSGAGPRYGASLNALAFHPVSDKASD